MLRSPELFGKNLGLPCSMASSCFWMKFANSDANRKNYSRLVSDQAADTQIRAVEAGLNKGSMWGRYLRTAYFVGETTMGPALFETGSAFLAIGPAWSWVPDREKHLPTASTQPAVQNFTAAGFYSSKKISFHCFFSSFVVCGCSFRPRVSFFLPHCLYLEGGNRTWSTHGSQLFVC